MSIHSKLHPQFDEKMFTLPPACHTLFKKEKQNFS